MMKLRCQFVALLLNLTLFLAKLIISVNPKKSVGVWEGWGCSLAWWSKIFGDRNDIADMLFTLEHTKLDVACNITLPGLNFNVVRYNAGASSWNIIDDNTAMVESPNIISSRQIDSYWQDWYNDNPDSSSWDWSIDANQRDMLLKSQARGANLFELFSNSPVWWMLLNYNPSGSTTGRDNNLNISDNHQFVHYLTAIAQYALNHWNITFQYIEPFNEPMSNWWTSTNNQEGCHFSTNSQSDVILCLQEALRAEHLISTTTTYTTYTTNTTTTNTSSSVKITASDETSYTLALSSWLSMNSTVQAAIAKVNVHGYEYDDNGTMRTKLYNAVTANQTNSSSSSTPSTKLWNSEYGDGDATGITMVSNVLKDFHFLHMTAWVYWQPLDGGGWGLLQADLQAAVLGVVNNKYYALAHFTRHVQRGAVVFNMAALSNSVAAYDSASLTLSIVSAYLPALSSISNSGNGNGDMKKSASNDTYCYDLSLFSLTEDAPGGSVAVRRWNTVLSEAAGDKYTAHNDVTLSAGDMQFCVEFTPNSVQSFEIDHIVQS